MEAFKFIRTGEDFLIRKMTSGDRALYYELADEFYRSPAVLHPVPKAHYERTFEQMIAQDNPSVEGWLLLQEGEPAGYAQLSFVWSNEAGGEAAWVEELYVRPAFQGRGLGAAFFRFLDGQYAGRIRRVRLEVEPDNLGARRLYERLGYEELPYLQMYREVPEDDG